VEQDRSAVTLHILLTREACRGDDVKYEKEFVIANNKKLNT
jgi:hypothetical protein